MSCASFQGSFGKNRSSSRQHIKTVHKFTISGMGREFSRLICPLIYTDTGVAPAGRFRYRLGTGDEVGQIRTPGFPGRELEVTGNERVGFVSCL